MCNRLAWTECRNITSSERLVRMFDVCRCRRLSCLRKSLIFLIFFEKLMRVDLIVCIRRWLHMHWRMPIVGYCRPTSFFLDDDVASVGKGLADLERVIDLRP